MLLILASLPSISRTQQKAGEFMPLVRIKLRKGKNAAYRQQVGRAVYEAMVSVGVPLNDRFQIIGEHAADNFLFDPDYLGIHRTDDLIIIQITWTLTAGMKQSRSPAFWSWHLAPNTALSCRSCLRHLPATTNEASPSATRNCPSPRIRDHRSTDGYGTLL
jgi:Tautomerase enzyme